MASKAFLSDFVHCYFDVIILSQLLVFLNYTFIPSTLDIEENLPSKSS